MTVLRQGFQWHKRLCPNVPSPKRPAPAQRRSLQYLLTVIQTVTDVGRGGVGVGLCSVPRNRMVAGSNLPQTTA